MHDPEELQRMVQQLSATMETIVGRLSMLDNLQQRVLELIAANNRMVDGQGIETEFILARLARLEAKTPAEMQAAQERLFALEERKKVFRLRHDLRGGSESKNDSTSG